MVYSTAVSSPPIKKTWKPVAAGVLSMILGCQWLLGGLGLLLIGIACQAIGRNIGVSSSSTLTVISAITLPLFIVGALAIRGSIYSLKRKRWGFALAGSIAAFLPICAYLIVLSIALSNADYQTRDSTMLAFHFIEPLLYALLGIAAIVLTAISRNEFE
jgi:hypothetical protein